MFAGHKSRRALFCWATPNAEPTPSCDAYRPRFGPNDGMNHIFDNCGVCLGSMTVANNSPAAWEAGFLTSNFKTNGNLPAKPYDITKRFTRVGQLEHAIAEALSARG